MPVTGLADGLPQRYDAGCSIYQYYCSERRKEIKVDNMETIALSLPLPIPFSGPGSREYSKNNIC